MKFDWKPDYHANEFVLGLLQPWVSGFSGDEWSEYMQAVLDAADRTSSSYEAWAHQMLQWVYGDIAFSYDDWMLDLGGAAEWYNYDQTYADVHYDELCAEYRKATAWKEHLAERAEAVIAQVPEWLHTRKRFNQELESLSREDVDKFVTQGNHSCPRCGEKMRREYNSQGGDAWYFRCPNSHQLWVGK